MGLISGDPNKDIFEQNPEIEYISAVKAFIKKVGGKKKASRLLWAVYLTEDPNSKLYRIMDREERRNEIAANYLNEKDFEWEELDDLCLEYGKIALSKEEIFFTIWGQKIDELQVYLKTTDIANNTDQVLKVLEKIPKIVEGYEKTKSEMLASYKKNKTFGKRQESLSETGTI